MGASDDSGSADRDDDDDDDDDDEEEDDDDDDDDDRVLSSSMAAANWAESGLASISLRILSNMPGNAGGLAAGARVALVTKFSLLKDV